MIKLPNKTLQRLATIKEGDMTDIIISVLHVKSLSKICFFPSAIRIIFVPLFVAPFYITKFKDSVDLLFKNFEKFVLEALISPKSSNSYDDIIVFVLVFLLLQ